MMKDTLDEQRCHQCNRLLFRGVLGIGFIEAKCNRCGTVSLIHNFDGILQGRQGAYVITFDRKGTIIVTSKSVEDVLGYDADELVGKLICDVRADKKLPKLAIPENIETLEDWEVMHARMPATTTHLTKDGRTIHASARYYPLHAMTRMYTLGIYFTDTNVPSVSVT